MASLEFQALTRHGLVRVGQLAARLLTFASVAACGEAQPEPSPPACSAAFVTAAYRIDHIDLAVTARLAEQYSFDLDGDGLTENAAAGLWSALTSNFETAAEALPLSVDTALADGRVNWILVTGWCPDEGSRLARVTLLRARPGPTGYEVVPDEVAPALGWRRVDGFWASDGLAVVPVTTLADVLGTHAPEWIHGRAFAVEMAGDGNGGMDGRLGLALPDGYQQLVAGPLADYFTSRLVAGTSALAAQLDADGDSRVTAEELLANEWMSLLLEPDLDLTAPYADADADPAAQRDSLSLGVGFHATPVDLAP